MLSPGPVYVEFVTLLHLREELPEKLAFGLNCDIILIKAKNPNARESGNLQSKTLESVKNVVLCLSIPSALGGQMHCPSGI